MKGNNVSHWNTLFDADVGDIVIHYTNGNIVGVSRVVGKAEKASNPYPNNIQWDSIGKRLPIEYEEIKPISKESISLNIRIEDKSVFDKNVKQGYFFLIDDVLKKEIDQLLKINA